MLFIGKYIGMIFLEDERALAPSGGIRRSQGDAEGRDGRGVGRQDSGVVRVSSSGTRWPGGQISPQQLTFLPAPHLEVEITPFLPRRAVVKIRYTYTC